MELFVNPDKTVGEQADRVHRFYQYVCDARDKHPEGKTDARRNSLNNVAMAANAAVTTLRLIDWATLGGEAVLVAALRLAKPEFVKLVTEDLLRAARLFLLVETQFQIEAAFRTILMALGKSDDQQGFYNVAKAVLAETGVNDQPIKLRVLSVPAFMRNSMHSNGIHHGYKRASTVETINGVEFRFDDGRRVSCGSWFHIVAALTGAIDVVDIVFTSPAVATLKELPDEYSQQRAAADAQ